MAYLGKADQQRSKYSRVLFVRLMPPPSRRIASPRLVSDNSADICTAALLQEDRGWSRFPGDLLRLLNIVSTCFSNDSDADAVFEHGDLRGVSN